MSREPFEFDEDGSMGLETTSGISVLASRQHLEAMYRILQRNRKWKLRHTGAGVFKYECRDETAEVVWNADLNCPQQITIIAKKTGIPRVYTLRDEVANG